jgi:C4-dicarboxylate transporter DctQ subunit
VETVDDKVLVQKKGVFECFTRGFDKTVDFFAVIAKILICVAAVITTADIFLRFFFNKPLMWSIEITEYCLIWITFLGTAWVLRREGHVMVDVIVSRIPTTSRHLLNAILSIIGILMCLLLTWYGAKVTLDFLQLGRPMSTILMPQTWILYIIVPIGSLLLTVQFIRRTLNFISKWKASKNTIPERAV